MGKPSANKMETKWVAAIAWDTKQSRDSIFVFPISVVVTRKEYSLIPHTNDFLQGLVMAMTRGKKQVRKKSNICVYKSRASALNALRDKKRVQLRIASARVKSAKYELSIVEQDMEKVVWSANEKKEITDELHENIIHAIDSSAVTDRRFIGVDI